MRGQGVPIPSGRSYGLKRPAAWCDQPEAGGSLGRCFSKNPGGLAKWEGKGFAARILGSQSRIFGGGQVMAALKASDVIAVDVGVVAQVSVTTGAALEPEHGLTSFKCINAETGLEASASAKLSLTCIVNGSALAPPYRRNNYRCVTLRCQSCICYV